MYLYVIFEDVMHAAIEISKKRKLTFMWRQCCLTIAQLYTFSIIKLAMNVQSTLYLRSVNVLYVQSTFSERPLRSIYVDST